MIEVTVQSLGLDQATKTPVVILRELDGERVLPIWIGPAEASAIAMELAGMKFARPLTHDLAASLIRGLGGVLQRVTISRVQDNTYFAELMIARDHEVFSIDARPSDSIAIALRLRARLFTSEGLLTDTTIETAEDEDEAEPEPQPQRRGEPAEPRPLSADELQAYLRKLGPEDLGRFNP